MSLDKKGFSENMNKEISTLIKIETMREKDKHKDIMIMIV